ncbi:hypothetical protein [Eleftheria terrae]|uniref:hypothetical protein n=1 Tax=Eleftheria terrae TaxID=1597781 RepID=UPI00263B3DAE|nr:hypothetical protein [Eleftheria terrae]WKB54368.1 hypothetical protein N7L95_08270 [Eleftheria terrae]
MRRLKFWLPEAKGRSTRPWRESSATCRQPNAVTLHGGFESTRINSMTPRKRRIMDTHVSLQELTIRISRTPRTVFMCGREVAVHELGIRLPFTRKPQTLEDVGGGEPQRIFVTSTRHLTAEEYDEFTGDLMRRREWVTREGGLIWNAWVCVELVAPDRPVLYVNFEGADYARYVARLG